MGLNLVAILINFQFVKIIRVKHSAIRNVWAFQNNRPIIGHDATRKVVIKVLFKVLNPSNSISEAFFLNLEG